MARLLLALALLCALLHGAAAAPVPCEADKDCPLSFCSGQDFIRSYCDPRARLCAMQIVVCQDSIECTMDSCSAAGCHFDASPCKCIADVQCEDGNHCTTDACSNGKCTHTPVAGCCRNDEDCSIDTRCEAHTCVAWTRGNSTVPQGGGGGMQAQEIFWYNNNLNINNNNNCKMSIVLEN